MVGKDEVIQFEEVQGIKARYALESHFLRPIFSLLLLWQEFLPPLIYLALVEPLL